MEAVSDRGLGLGLAFGVLGLLGALGMFVTGVSGDQIGAAWSFAGAMVGAALLIAAIHVFE